MRDRVKDRVAANCEDCFWFSWREHVPLADQRPFGQHLDGYCSKIFPRGYVGAGKPGGNVYHGKNACFQYRPKEEETDQLSIWPGG